MRTFVKRNPAAPAGFFGCEAAGLHWLSDAHGVRCAELVGYDDTSLTMVHLDAAPPSRDGALAFGAALARTHDAGAPRWGAPPADWSGPGFFGPLQHPLPMSYTGHDSWGSFYAEERLRPMLQRARAQLRDEAVVDVEMVLTRCAAGDFDDDDTPARLHGDLWHGNLMWTADGAVLIDPAAHGGHREADLAMLNLFGCAHYDAVIEGYQQEHALRAGLRERQPLHQLYPLLAHVALFGAGYAHQTHAAAHKVLGLTAI